MDQKEAAPQLTFECPKHWNSMSGSETERFCDTCGHTVQNLSLLPKARRAELIEQSANQQICATFCQDLEGNLITAKSQKELSAKIKTARLAAIAAGSLALTSCSPNSGPDHDIPLPGIICPPPEEGK